MLRDRHVRHLSLLTQSSKMLNPTFEETDSSWTIVSKKKSPKRVTQLLIAKKKVNVDQKKKVIMRNKDGTAAKKSIESSIERLKKESIQTRKSSPFPLI